MKTIAILSDIHANLPALESVIEDLAGRRGLLGAYHLGDLVGYAPWPNEVVALLRKEGVQGIAGNYDSTVATRYDHCGCSYEDPRDIELARQSYSWTLEHTNEGSRSYLGSLPFRMDLRPNGGHRAGPKVTLVHGNPSLNTVYWTADRSDSFCLQMAERLGSNPGDTIVFGHTHKPWQKEIQGILFVNAGSVGRPKDGDWRACYVLLDWGESVGAEFVRVEYDLGRAQQGIRASGLPHEFAEVLETAGGRKPF